jgi:hypothetical protein
MLQVHHLSCMGAAAVALLVRARPQLARDTEGNSNFLQSFETHHGGQINQQAHQEERSVQAYRRQQLELQTNDITTFACHTSGAAATPTAAIIGISLAPWTLAGTLCMHLSRFQPGSGALCAPAACMPCVQLIQRRSIYRLSCKLSAIMQHEITSYPCPACSARHCSAHAQGCHPPCIHACVASHTCSWSPCKHQQYKSAGVQTLVGRLPRVIACRCWLVAIQSPGGTGLSSAGKQSPLCTTQLR